MKRKRMLLRILFRSLLVRPGRALVAVGAVAVASAATTAALTLYLDTQSKLEREFRSYGANLVITARPGVTLPPDALAKVESTLGPAGSAAPFAFAVARTSQDRPVVVVGADFERTRRLNSWWAVDKWPSASGEALMGQRVQKLTSAAGGLTLIFSGRFITLHPVGTLRTGSAEDERVYLSLADFSAWTGLAVSTMEAAAPGSPQQIAKTAARLAAALPEASVRPVRQITETQGRIIQKTGSTLLAVVIFITLTTAICVLATLTSSVLDRRRDFALMQALGATQAVTARLFTLEAVLLGVTGGIIGYGFGLAVAALISWLNFHASVSPQIWVLPQILLGSMALALLTAIIPLALLRRIQAASVLKGE